MNKQQAYVMWIGLLLLLAYLFTDASVRNMIFGRGSGAKTSTNTFLASAVSGLPAGGSITPASGLPSSTGNGQNNGNPPKVILA